MLSSFFSGISGLMANSCGINVVGNNIANVNTIGYKGARTTFQDVLYQSVFGTAGTSQIGRGTALMSVDTLFSQGSFESTSESTDLAIGGKGFFVVRQLNGDDPATDQTTSLYYTRAGQFRFDEEGYLVNPAGYLLQGRHIDRVTHTPTGVDDDILISPEPSQPRESSFIAMACNLQQDAPWAGTIGSLTQVPAGSTGPLSNSPAASENGYPESGNYTIAYTAAAGGTLTLTNTTTGDVYTQTGVTAGTSYTDFGGSGLTVTAAGTLTAGVSQTFTVGGFDATDATTTSRTSNYSSSVTVYDSIGQSHIVTVYFRKTGAGEWEWNAVAPDTVGGPTTTTGTLNFTTQGLLAAGSGAPESLSLTYQAGAPQTIDLAFDGSLGGNATTQYPMASTTNFQTQDGYPPGVLMNVTVSPEGVISGHYSNGQILDLYQLTLANFNNPQGLSREGGNLFAETLESGVPYTNAPGQNGLGKINPNSLEQSNVDLATEFVKMIISQRGFQANSRVITTTDEILGELMNLKR
ncbi:MAG: Flagellar hook protein FlgE [Syntrophorhabdus sp. PtaU1.Bin002]|nr:MAG: Flagellar hook protein FlgE [Syntrophorhabdus sp. PtaB.Bin006]OPY65744.1 MAG: Flagellar hook protein FlgE [Syntrophorhabdus sp. PtaU1.Bin002]